MRLGARGAVVASIQTELLRHQVPYVRRADGFFNSTTRLAVIVFQRHYGLPQTGVVDAATAALLYGPVGGGGAAVAAATGPAGWSDVGSGARGATVAAIQRTLMNAGIFLRGGADGVFGAQTRAAVQIFQRHYGLPATGVVDTATAQAMGLYTPPPPPPPPPPVTEPPPPAAAGHRAAAPRPPRRRRHRRPRRRRPPRRRPPTTTTEPATTTTTTAETTTTTTVV